MVFLSLGYFLQNEIPSVELVWAYLFVESVLYSSLIQSSVDHGGQSLTSYKIHLIKASFGPFQLLQP